jgi:hypothetical protein
MYTPAAWLGPAGLLTAVVGADKIRSLDLGSHFGSQVSDSLEVVIATASSLGAHLESVVEIRKSPTQRTPRCVGHPRTNVAHGSASFEQSSVMTVTNMRRQCS